MSIVRALKQDTTLSVFCCWVGGIGGMVGIPVMTLGLPFLKPAIDLLEPVVDPLYVFSAVGCLVGVSAFDGHLEHAGYYGS